MGMYKYQAKKGPGEVIESVVYAASEKEAVEKISQMGYLPVRLEEINSAASALPAKMGFFQQRVNPKLVTVFSRQLSILLKSGVPILNGLTILIEQSDSYYFKTVLGEIRQDIKNGKSLSLGLLRYPQLFPPLYIALVKAGEDSGTLENSLLRIAEYRHKQEQILSHIRTALTYPILMAIVGTGTIIFMLTFVMPRLLKIFFKLGQDLPLPTRILIGMSNFLTQNWFWLVLILCAMVLLVKRGAPSRKEQLYWSSLRLRLPFFGEIFLKAELARFSRTLQLLLKSGIQLLKAIRVGIPTLNNEIIKEALRKGYKEIEQGETFGNILKRSRIFPKFMISLVSVGEESGRLDEVLEELANTYESDTDEAIKIMTNLLEPLLILVMGVVVGFIIVSMLLPIFQINVMIQ